jgi:hypothetical protein
VKVDKKHSAAITTVLRALQSAQWLQFDGSEVDSLFHAKAVLVELRKMIDDQIESPAVKPILAAPVLNKTPEIIEKTMMKPKAKK